MLDLLIIGAGPAGISLAAEARAAGIEKDKILLLEKAEEHSFTIKKYYPESKLVTANYKGFEAVCTGVMCIVDSTKHQAVSYLDDAIDRNGIAVRYGETVTKIHKHGGEQRFTLTTERGIYEAKVVAIAIGILGKPNKPEYRLPPSLRASILFDVTSRDIAGLDVLVVGGGDSASEYVQYLAQRGNRVALSYRRTEFTRMNEINRQSLLALSDRRQAELLLGTNIVQVADRQGRPEVYFAEEARAPRVFDVVVYALGGTTPENFLKMIGIYFDGPQPVLQEGYETSVPGLFLTGDLSAGSKGGSINWAFNSANTAMRKMLELYLQPD